MNTIDITSEVQMPQTRKAKLLGALLLCVIALGLFLYAFTPVFTGHTVFEQTVQLTLNKNYSATREDSLNITQSLKSLRISGSIIGEGNATIWLKTSSGVQYKIYDTREIPAHSPGSNLITGQVIGENNSNETINDTSNLTAFINDTSTIDNTTINDTRFRNDTAPIHERIIDSNFTHETIVSNMTVPAESFTIDNTTHSGAANITENLTENTTTNITAIMTENITTMENTTTTENMTKHQALPPETSGSLEALTPPAENITNITRNMTKNVTLSVIESRTFSDVCLETCALSGVEPTYTIYIEIDGNATLTLNTLHYTYEESIVQTKPIENITVVGTASINLSEYFTGQKLIYDITTLKNSNVSIAHGILTLTALMNGTETAKIYAVSGNSMLESNAFIIRSSTLETTEITDTIDIEDNLTKDLLKDKFKKLDFSKVIKRLDKIKNTTASYDIEFTPKQKSPNKVKIAELKNISTLESIDFIDYKQHKQSKVMTDVVVINALNITNATIILKKSGQVNAIARCDNYTIATATCAQWVITAIPFIDHGDSIEFTVTHFSAYGGIIEITKAEHLDENRTFIADIYNETQALDNVWSEPIYTHEYVRVMFKQNLTATNDITVYVRNVLQANTRIAVYEKDSAQIIALFPSINETKYYTAYLSNLTQPQAVFDLRIVNADNDSHAYLEFDHIVDPTYTMTSNSASVSATNISTGSRLNVSVNVTVDSNKGVWSMYINSSLITGGSALRVDGSCTGSDSWKVVRFIEDGVICATGSASSNLSAGMLYCDGAAGTAIEKFEVEACSGANFGDPYTFYSDCQGNSGSDACAGFGDATSAVSLYGPPLINSSRMSPTTAYTISTLQGYCNATEGDGQTVKYYYIWYLNGAQNTTGSTSSNYTQGLEINVANVSSSLLAIGQNWTFACLGSDGTNSSWLNSSTITIQSLAPLMNSSRISPLIAYANDTLLGYCNATSPAGLNVSYNWKWYLNGIQNTTGTTTSNYTQGLEINVANVSSSQLAAGQNWALSCLASDGNLNSTWMNSTTLSIITPPTINSSRMTPSTPQDNDVLFGYCNATANNGTLLYYNYMWYVNGVANTTGTLFKEGSISAGNYHTCGIRANDSRVMCWGKNTEGELGDGTTSDKYTPTLINDSSAYLMVSASHTHTCAIRANDSRVLCWGGNVDGEIGDGTTTSPRLNPTLANASYGFKYISTGIYDTCAIRANDSRMLCWGGNTYAQVGDGTAVNPRPNPTLTNITVGFFAATNGERFSCGIRINDSRVMCWGTNGEGELGDGTISTRLNPVNINDAAAYIAISSGQYHTCAIRANDSRMLCWGYNNYGQLGDGTGNTRLNPVLVNVSYGFSAVTTNYYTTLGIRANDSRIIGWGTNAQDQTGDGTQVTPRANPVLASDSSAFSSITSGSGHGCAVRINDSRVLCWGYNLYGEVGDGTTTTPKLSFTFINDSSGYFAGFWQGQERLVDVIDSTTTTNGQTWMLSCQVNDSQNASNWMNSTSVCIGGNCNIPPIIFSSRISPSIAYANDTLRGYCNATDVDNNNLTYNWKWYLNGVQNTTGTTNNYTQGLDANVADISSGNLSIGQNWTLSCQANDGTTNSSWLNSSVIVINAPYGSLSVAITAPSTDISVDQNSTFYLNATVTCTGATGAVCGIVYANARYNTSSATPDTLINTTGGGTPVYMMGNRSMCYQESANVSTACGGLSTGTYANESTAGWNALSNLTDENWSSYGYTAGLGGDSATLYINYTKPSGSSNTSLWQIANGNDTFINVRNISLPQLCWDYSATIIRLKVVSGNGALPSADYVTWSCYNGTGYFGLNTTTSNHLVYEDAMWWNISGSSNPQTSPTSLSQGQSWSANWTVNATGTTGTSYVVDVLFNSSYGASNVSNNDTANKQICIGSCSSNAAPVMNASRISPTSPRINSTLLGYCNATDGDNDNVTYSWVWYKNSVQNRTGIMASNYTPRIEINVANITDTLTPYDNWTLSCQANDSINVSSWMNSSNVTIMGSTSVTANNFNGATTNFRYYDTTELTALANVILEKVGIGKIAWNAAVNVSSVNFDANIIMGANAIYVNSSALSSTLNSSANLTLYNVPYDQPIITRDGEICTTCTQFSFVGGTLTFNVSGFSNYSTVQNTSMRIWDNNEGNASLYDGNTLKYVNQTVFIYANYSNATSNVSITGATCVLNISNGFNGVMSYNSTPALYYQNLTFNNAGVYTYNISCNTTGFAKINLTNTINVTINPFPVMHTPRIAPSPAYANESLRGYCNASDANTNELYYAWIWYLNGAVNSTGNTTGGGSSGGSNWTYQENSNGTAYSGSWDSFYGVSYIYDGTWTTYFVYSTAGAYYYANYTKPANAQNNSLWQVADAAGTVNLSIDVSCWSQTPLQFGLYNNQALSITTWSCWNGSSWTTLRNVSSTLVYEEAIWWNITTAGGGSGTNYTQGLEVNVANVSSSNLSASQNWTFSCQANDSALTSFWLNSSVTTIQSLNAAPVMNSSRISPSIAYANDTLLGYCNATDADNNNVTYSWIWYLNGATNASGATSSNYTQSLEVNVANVSSNNLFVGDNWTLSCRANDSQSTSSWLNSSNVMIQPNASTTLNILFVPPTPDSGTSTLNTSTIVNVSINASAPSNLSGIIWNWNGTNYTMYNNSVVLLYNLNNVPVFGENASSNKTFDASVYGNNGTCQNMGAGCSYVAGKYGSGLQFDGINDYVNVSNPAPLNDLGPATWSLWVKRNSLTNYGTLLYKSDGNTDDGWWIDFRNNGGPELGVQIVYSTANIKRYTNTSLPGVGQWFHLAVTWDNTSVNSGARVYIDGVEVAYSSSSGPTGTHASDAGDPLYIGWGLSGAPNYFNGSIDEVMIWNRNLSASEISQLYKSNLYKYDSSNWQFTANQSNLSSGSYSYFACMNDTAGLNNCTETRILTITNISNTPPVINSSRISPSIAYANDTLLGYCNATDADGTNLTYNWKWFLNGAQNTSGTTSSNYTQSLEVNVANVSSGNLSVGQNWTFSCQANDTQATSSWLNSSNVIVQAPFGSLSVIITSPPADISMNQNSTFYLNATVTCNGAAGAICGIVYANARYNATSTTPDTLINTTSGATPFVMTSGGNGSPVHVWNVTDINGNNSFGVAVDSSGNVYTAGRDNSNDYYTVKYNSSGSQVWNVTDTHGYWVYGIAVDASSNVYVTGYTSSNDWYTVKYNSSGSQVWNVTDTTGYRPGGIAVDSSGNVYVTGNLDGASSYYYTVKYNSSGSQVWNITDTAGKYAYGIAVDTSGNFYITGEDSSFNYYTAKYNSSGSKLWNVTDTIGTEAYGIAVDTSSNVYVTGYTGSGDYYTVKYNSTGQQLWTAADTYGDTANSVAVDSSGNVYVAGYNSTFDWYTVKYNSSGSQVWNVTDANGYKAYGIAVDSSHNVYVTGNNGTYYYTIKYSQASSQSNPQTSSGSLTQGQSWNVTWTANATGSTGSSYFIDVLFNSSYGASNITANDTADRKITITSANTPPSITTVPAIVAQDPVESQSKLIAINFTVNDPDGNATINISSAIVTVNNSGITRTTTACSGSAINATAQNISCNLTLNYYDPAGSWSLNVSIKDASGAYTENTTTTFTYNELSAITLSLSTLDFGTLAIGAENKTASPIVINNTGNINYSAIAIKGYDLANGSYLIGAANFSINTTNSSTGILILNNTLINITGAALAADTDAVKSNETLYPYVDVPNTVLPAAVYRAIAEWVLVPSK